MMVYDLGFVANQALKSPERFGIAIDEDVWLGEVRVSGGRGKVALNARRSISERSRSANRFGRVAPVGMVSIVHFKRIL